MFQKAEAMEKKATAIEKINAYMQPLEAMERKFNPLPHFTLHMVLSQISPQFYTEDELIEIEKINESLCQEIDVPLISQNNSKGVRYNNKKRHCSSDKGNMSDEGRRVKPKNHDKKTLSSPPPELPSHVRHMIKTLDGSDIKYIMCKTLFKSDLSSNNNRLSIPISQVQSDFLFEIEKATLETKDREGRPVGLNVMVLDPYFNEFSMSLKKWDMKSTSIYNLIQDWTLVLKKNNFKEKQMFNIWSFRVKDKLYLLLENHKSQKRTKESKGDDC